MNGVELSDAFNLKINTIIVNPKKSFKLTIEAQDKNIILPLTEHEDSILPLILEFWGVSSNSTDEIMYEAYGEEG